MKKTWIPITAVVLVLGLSIGAYFGFKASRNSSVTLVPPTPNVESEEVAPSVQNINTSQFPSSTDLDHSLEISDKVSEAVKQALVHVKAKRFTEAVAVLDEADVLYGKELMPDGESTFETQGAYIANRKKLVSCYEKRGLLRSFPSAETYKEALADAFRKNSKEMIVSLFPCGLLYADDAAPDYSSSVEPEETASDVFNQFTDPSNSKIFDFRVESRESRFQFDFKNGRSLLLEYHLFKEENFFPDPLVGIITGPKEAVDEVSFE